MSTLTRAELESHLWGAANILRGKIDSSDNKHYIFGLLFYKRICDVWQEEYDALLKEYGGDKEMALDPDEHRFHIPKGQFWDDVRKKSIVSENSKAIKTFDRVIANPPFSLKEWGYDTWQAGDPYAQNPSRRLQEI